MPAYIACVPISIKTACPLCNALDNSVVAFPVLINSLVNQPLNHRTAMSIDRSDEYLW